MVAEFTLNNLIYLDTIDSTNLYAQELLKSKKVSEGSVIMAQHQTAGKGQRGASWQSKPNENLLFSLILEPTFLPVSKLFYLSKIIALALVDFLDKMAVGSAAIKWPNDILIAGKKIAGILIENNLSAACINSTVVGIGININQTVFDKEMHATSLKNEQGIEVQPRELLSNLLLAIHSRYIQLHQKEWQKIDEDYLQRLYKYKIWAGYQDQFGNFQGSIQAVRDNGQLEIVTEKGELRTYNIKEVRFIN